MLLFAAATRALGAVAAFTQTGAISDATYFFFHNTDPRALSHQMKSADEAEYVFHFFTNSLYTVTPKSPLFGRIVRQKVCYSDSLVD